MRKFYQNFSLTHSLSSFKALSLTILFSAFLGISQSNAQAGNALSYDGVDDFTTLPANIVQGLTGSFTIEAWVYYRGGSAWQRIFDFGTDPNNFIFLTAQANETPNFGVRFAIRIGALGGLTRVIDAPSPLATNAWSHVAVTVDASTTTGKLYINGVLSGTSTIDHFPSELGATTNNWIGRSQFNTDPYLNGIVDELRISNVVRYTSNFTVPPQFTTDANTVALYHFNEGTGQTTADASGNFGNAFLGADATVETTDPTWITNSILPVKLIDFTATVNATQKAVDVKWTASVDAATEFIVERSINGIQFTPVGTVNAANSLPGQQDYSFRDSHPLSGRSYYRLKSTELGSPSLYSRIAPVNFGLSVQILVYPNPVRGRSINIELANAYSGNMEISLVNTSGAVVYKQNFSAVNQRQFVIQGKSSIPAGSYLMRLTANGLSQSTMVIYQ